MFIDNRRGFTYRFIEYGLYIFIVLFPFIFYIGHLFYGTTSRSVNMVFVVEILAVVLGFALLSAKNRVSVAKSPITISLFLLLVVLFISGLQGVDWGISFWSRATRMSGIFYFLHIGLFYLFLLMIFKDSGKLRNFLKVFLISTAIFSIGALLSRDGFGLIYATKAWTGFTFGNSSFAAMYVYAAFMASIYYVYTLPASVKRWWHNLIPLIFVINPYFIHPDVWLGKINLLQNPLGFVGAAQASTFAVIFSVLFLAFAWGVSKIRSVNIRRTIIWITVAVGLASTVFVVTSFLTPGGFIQRAYLEQATIARPIVWELSKEAISEKPVLGWGGDNFDRAFEAHYNNTLLEQKNGAEPWFDRAHNIIIDQAVESGYVGLSVYILVFLAIIGSMLYVLFKSKDKGDQALSIILITYFVGHFLELQTAFDTTISYPGLVTMTALSAAVFHKTYSALVGEKSEWWLSSGVKYGLATVLVGVFGYLFIVGTVPIIRAQTVNGAIRTVGSSEGRMTYYEKLFGSPVDKATFLWRTTIDLQKGVAEKPQVLEKPEKLKGFIAELEIYTREYEEYLATHPRDYRMHISLANVYIYQRLFEVNNLDKAHVLLDQAILLVPEGPQPYWMKAVAYLYQGKFAEARTWAKKAYDLNPDIEQSQMVVDYIDRSIKSFPEITLYNFRQI